MARLEDETGVHPGAGGVCSFLVPGDASGISYGRKEQKMGWNSQPTRTINFDDVRCPSAISSAPKARVSRSRCKGSTAAASTSPPARSEPRRPRSIRRRATCASASSSGRRSRQLPGAAVQAGRHGDRTGRGAHRWCDSPRGSSIEGSGRHHLLRNGQALRHRRGLRRLQRRRCNSTAATATSGSFPLNGTCGTARVHQILEGTNEIMRVIIARRVLMEGATEVIR